MSRLFYVFLGGGAGSVARYLTAVAATRLIPIEFPFGTLIVNVVGCFLIGAIHTIAMVSATISPEARFFLTTGVLGGFTTYSAFNYDALHFVEQGQSLRAAVYAAATIIGCAIAGALGVWSARAFVRAV